MNFTNLLVKLGDLNKDYYFYLEYLNKFRNIINLINPKFYSNFNYNLIKLLLYYIKRNFHNPINFGT